LVKSSKHPKSAAYPCLFHAYSIHFCIPSPKASPNIASHRAGATPLLLALMADSSSSSQPLVTVLLDAKAEVSPRLQEIWEMLLTCLKSEKNGDLTMDLSQNNCD
jgi:hypothetical protein